MLMALRILVSLLIAPLTVPLMARAETPDLSFSVATDIAPIQSLVQAVMRNVGTPVLIIPPGASAHSYAMRPSEARALEQADLVFWVGEALTPWLVGPVMTLAKNAKIITLSNTPGTRKLPLHDEAVLDPHLWLDPGNANIWLNEIALQLAEHDPENAEVYWANATQMQSEIRQVSTQVLTILSPVKGLKYITYHDSFQYFEQAFDLASLGTLLASDAAPAGAAHLAKLRASLQENKVTCLLSEPGASAALIANIASPNLQITQADPLGVTRDNDLRSDLIGTPDLYPQMLLSIALALRACQSVSP